MKTLRFPSAYSVLFLIAGLVAAITWVVPAGKFDTLAYDKDGNHFVRKTFLSRDVDSTLNLPAEQQTLDEAGLKIPLEKFTTGSITKPVAIPGSYHALPSNPQGVTAFIQAPLVG